MTLELVKFCAYQWLRHVVRCHLVCVAVFHFHFVAIDLIFHEKIFDIHVSCVLATTPLAIFVKFDGTFVVLFQDNSDVVPLGLNKFS